MVQLLSGEKRKLLVAYAKEIREADAERKAAADQIKESLKSAEDAGLDKEAVRHAVKMLRDAEKIGAEQYELFDTVRDSYFLILREEILGIKSGEVALANATGRTAKEVREELNGAKREHRKRKSSEQKKVAKTARKAFKKKPEQPEGDLSDSVH